MKQFLGVLLIIASILASAHFDAVSRSKEYVRGCTDVYVNIMTALGMADGIDKDALTDYCKELRKQAGK